MVLSNKSCLNDWFIIFMLKIFQSGTDEPLAQKHAIIFFLAVSYDGVA